MRALVSARSGAVVVPGQMLVPVGMQVSRDCHPLLRCEAPDRFALTGSGRGEQGECLGAGGSGLGVVDDERLAVGVGDRQLLVAELKGSDLRVVEQACAAALGPGVVSGP